MIEMPNKTRNCFVCNVEIQYFSFAMNTLDSLNARGKYESPNDISRIWKDTNVEIMCCDCYHLYTHRRIDFVLELKNEINNRTVISGYKKRKRINILDDSHYTKENSRYYTM